MSIHPGQVWEETAPADGHEPERIVITGISQKNGLAFFVPADPAKPADEQSHCSLMAFWPRSEEEHYRLIADQMGLYRLVVDAPRYSTTVVDVDWARSYAAEQLARLADSTADQQPC